MISDQEICKLIVNHLSQQHKVKENLNSIILNVIDSECGRLGERIIQNISYLMSIRVIEEFEHVDERYYRLSIDALELENYLQNDNLSR